MARVVAIVVVLLTLASQAAFGADLYRCRFTGQVKKTGCCAAHQRPSAEPCSGPLVERAPCCDVIQRNPSATPVKLDEARAPQLVVSIIEAAPSVAVAPLRTRPRHARSLRAPPGTDRTLLAQRTSFQI